MTSAERGFRTWALNGVPVLTAPGEIDLRNAAQLRDVLVAASTGRLAVVVDFRANQFCDSSGISALITAWKAARAAGAEIRLVMDQQTARRVFKVTGVHRVFRIFASISEAVAARHREAPTAVG